MPRWRSIWLVARREILERGRSRGFILSVAFTTLIVVGSFVIPAIVFGGDNPTKVGVVEPSPPGLQAAIEQSAQRFDHKVAITTYPDARGRRRGPQRRQRRDRHRRCRPTCPAPARSGSSGSRTRRPPRSSPRRPSRCASRPSSAGATSTRRRSPTRSGRPRPRRSRPQTEQDQAQLPRRQHRGGPDPRRHLQLRLHGPDRRRRGEAEPGRRGRPLDGPRPRPADGQGPRHRRPRDRPARGVHHGRVDRRARDGPSRAAHDDAGCGRPAGGLVRARLPALLDRARVPRRARVAAGGGLERLDAGDDGRDAQLLRGDLRGHRRPGRHGRDDRHVPPAVGAVRRARCGPPSMPSRPGRSACRRS